MNTRISVLAMAAVGVVGLAVSLAAAAEPSAPNLKYRAVAPQISAGDLPPSPTATPTARPTPYAGPVASLYLESAGLGSQWPVEIRDTVSVNGRETFADPSGPEWIAWYERFGHPGYGGNNSIFAAHINYIHFGNGPFANLTSAVSGDALYVTMADGTVYAYTVHSVELVSLDALQSGAMDNYVFPALDAHTERVTLISCGGDFVPRPGGGGDYTSRVILVAERYVP